MADYPVCDTVCLQMHLRESEGRERWREGEVEGEGGEVEGSR